MIATKFFVGCAGWSYDDWKTAGFYSHTLPKNAYLRRYAEVFNFVEINSSFYAPPSESMITHWDQSTPASFRFSVKVWQQLTHKRNISQLDEQISQFFPRFWGLREKISTYLLQFPPSFRHSAANIEYLHTLLHRLPKSSHFAVELRDNSWFTPSIMDDIFTSSHIFPVTSYLPGNLPYYSQPQSHYYVRLIGDRVLTAFNRTQRAQSPIMEDLLRKMKQLQLTPDITDIFVIFNNHFRGFSPHDVNEFKRLMALPVTSYRTFRSLLSYKTQKKK
jgi:uncharacterized protein YecE (DUF72 family)